MEYITIRILKPWGNYKPGDVIKDTTSSLIVQRLIREGIVERYVSEKGESEGNSLG